MHPERRHFPSLTIAFLATTMVTTLASLHPAQAQDHCGAGGVALQVLGSGNQDLGSKRASSSYLLWIDGKARVLINAGGGSALRFGESGAHVGDLDLVLFTQLDASHSSELPALVQSSRADARQYPLPLFGPAGARNTQSTVGLVRDLFDGARGAFRHLGEFLSPLDKTTYKLEPHDVREPVAKIGTPRPPASSPFSVWKNERVQVQAVITARAPAPALAWRIEAGDSSFVIGNGLLDDKDALRALAANAGVLVLPVSTLRGNPPAAVPVTEIAAIVSAAKPRQLLLAERGAAGGTHEETIQAAVRKSYSGSVTLADDLSCHRP
jgi:ribonuclease BN (tRNA processing enzyme)